MMNQMEYCLHCQKDSQYELKEHLIKMYKNSEVNVMEYIPVCVDCGNEIFIREIESNNLKRLYSKYRQLNDLIDPEEICEFREAYQISQRELTAILDWGKMTLNRYENGSVPSKSHSDFLKVLIHNEEMFKEKVEEAYSANRIKEKTYNKVMNLYESHFDKHIKQSIIEKLTHQPTILNGFKKFDFEKLENLISYLADKTTNLTKTSLNKYLWYIDFSNFKQNIRSVTGLRYMKYSHGPVIEDHLYYSLLDFSDKYETIEEEYGEYLKVTIRSKGNYDLSVFKESELQVIDEVIDKFSALRVGQISELSHKEDGWVKTEMSEIITYEYAEKLKAFN